MPPRPVRCGLRAVWAAWRHRHAEAVDNEISGHPIANVEVGDGCAPTLEGNTLEGSQGVGLLLAAGAGGVYRKNAVRRNGRAGVECCSKQLEGLLLEANELVLKAPSALSEDRAPSASPDHRKAQAAPTYPGAPPEQLGGLPWPQKPAAGRPNVASVSTSNHQANEISQQRRGVGALLLQGGAGRWRENTLAGNAVGMELGRGAAPSVEGNDVCENARTGVQLGAGASGCVRDNHIHHNGLGRVASGGRRGARTAGDDAGAGVVCRGTSATELVRNRIGSNAGAGVFADDLSGGRLAHNVLRDNQGAAISARPLSRSTTQGNLDGDRCPLQPTVVQRQRVPFDWTVGANVTAHDKTLQDRVGEMRASYRAMKGEDPAGVLALMPEGSGASEVCCVM